MLTELVNFKNIFTFFVPGKCRHVQDWPWAYTEGDEFNNTVVSSRALYYEYDERIWIEPGFYGFNVDGGWSYQYTKEMYTLDPYTDELRQMPDEERPRETYMSGWVVAGDYWYQFGGESASDNTTWSSEWVKYSPLSDLCVISVASAP